MEELRGAVGYNRPEQVINAVSRWNKDISEEDRHLKYCKMAVSPFTFYRGTDHLYWEDFAGDWRLKRFGNINTRTWLEGDAHLDNYGAFANSDGMIVYCMNDFDESIIADYQYDVWRMAISIVIVARLNGDLSAKAQGKVVDAFAQSYLDTMADYRGNDLATKTIFNADNLSGQLKQFLKEVKIDDSRVKMLNKWAPVMDGERRLNIEGRPDKLQPASAEEREAILAAMPQYGRTLSGHIRYGKRHFKVKDIARRLSAGTGSLGTPRYYVLIEGASKSQDDDHILDIKGQGRPSMYEYLSVAERESYDKTYKNDAQRQAMGYKALAIEPDAYLGWMKLSQGYFSVRERSPYKEAYPTNKAEMKKKQRKFALNTEKRFSKIAKQWGRIMATDHARADQVLPYDLVAEVLKLTKGEHKEFRHMVRDVAFGYADQVEVDWGYFVKELAPSDCS